MTSKIGTPRRPYWNPRRGYFAFITYLGVCSFIMDFAAFARRRGFYFISLFPFDFCFYPAVLLDQECADHAADDGNGCQDSCQLEGLFVFLNQLENYCCDCQSC